MSDPFTEQILKMVIAKVAKQCNFSTISETALNIFVDATIFYIQSISSKAGKITTHCGRTDTNGYDFFFALYHNANETPESLSHFLNRTTQIPPFEYSIYPYPLPMKTEYNTDKIKPTSTPHPFRIYVPIRDKSGNCSHIPDCYLDFPPKYTYSQGNMVPEPSVDVQIEAQRSKDQKKLQEQIDAISQNSDTKMQQTIKFESTLTKYVSNELVRKPTELLESPVYILNGERKNIDPENLPREDITENDLPHDLSKDLKAQLKILNTVHSATEPGKPDQSASTNTTQSSDKA